MSHETKSDDDADGLEAAEQAIDEEPEPGLGPGADDGSEGDADADEDGVDAEDGDRSDGGQKPTD